MMTEVAMALQARADEEEDAFKQGSASASAAKETRLYGRWQTVDWIPPQAKHGIVPKNERGNVLCPPLAHALPLVRESLTPEGCAAWNFNCTHRTWAVGHWSRK